VRPCPPPADRRCAHVTGWVVPLAGQPGSGELWGMLPRLLGLLTVLRICPYRSVEFQRDRS
jgi:hypothetical protein